MGANMILTIGAILLFGVFLNTSNQLMIGNNQIASQNEYYVTAISLAQSVIDEAKMKAFDQKTVSAAVLSPDSLTTGGGLGTDNFGEVISSPDTASNQIFQSVRRFNDVDDYNLYRRVVNTERAEGYQLAARVYYVSETNPDVASAGKTYCKKMTVNVWSSYFPDTVKLYYAFTY